MDIEKYIEGISPELQEKARACRNVDELLALAKQENLPVPDDALTAIAGGDGAEDGNCGSWQCPKCKSYNTQIGPDVDAAHFKVHCKDCGYDWVQGRWKLPM